MTRTDPLAAASAILAAKYPQARVMFVAGSVVRGEATATSDLDLVVVHDMLPRAFRESFMSGGWPVEAFVHDPETLRWFIDEAMATGVPTMATMIVEGIELPNPDALSAALKREARALLERGPPAWDAEALARSRYAITDIVDDLRDPRSRAELVASAARLYPLVADHWLRARGLWSARGKSIPRRLASVSPDFATAFYAAFATLFEGGDAERLIALCEQVLAPDGGWLFDGYLLRAPVSSRRIGSHEQVRS